MFRSPDVRAKKKIRTCEANLAGENSSFIFTSHIETVSFHNLSSCEQLYRLL